MPSKCSAPRCTNSNKDRYCCIKFARDPDVRQKWIDAVGISNWKPTKSAVLCEVHFRLLELFRVGNKKFMRRSAIPNLFCNCAKPMKRKPLAEIQSENVETQENKRCKRDHYISELKEHNYCFQKGKSVTFGSYKKYVHTAHCVVMKESINIKTLPEEKHCRLNSNLDIHTSSECATNQILSESISSLEEYQTPKEKLNIASKRATNQILCTNIVPSPEEYEILKEKLKMAEKERTVLQSTVNDLEKNIAENTDISNRVLNKDQQKAIMYGATRGSNWFDETIEKTLNLHFACGSHGYNQIIGVVAPFPSLRTLRNKIQHIKFKPRSI